MSLRSSLITAYLEDEQVYEIVWHDTTVYLKIWFWYLALGALIVAVWLLFQETWTDTTIPSWIAMWLLSALYIKWTLDLLDKYLDGLLITNVWLVLFEWNWLFRQTVTNIQRVSIETIQFEQNSFWDTIFSKWDIKLYVEDVTYTFKEVNSPAKKVARMISWKEKILWRYHFEENRTQPTESNENEKYELLIEALWEVVSEYVEKKKNF